MQARWILPGSVIANHQNSAHLQGRILEEVVAAVESGSKVEVVTMQRDPMASAWGVDVAAALHAKCAAAAKRCSIATKSAVVASGGVEISVVSR